MDMLTKLLGIYDEENEDKRKEALTAILASDEFNLADVRAELLKDFKALNEAKDHTDEALERMERLTEITEAVQATINAKGAAQDREERAGKLSEKMASLQVDEEREETQSVEKEQQSAQEDTSSTEVQQAEEKRELVTASSGTPVVDFRNLPSSGVVGKAPAAFRVNAAADIPGIPTGAELDGVKGLAAAVHARLSGLARLGKGRSSQVGIASISRNTSRDLMVDGDNATEAVRYATNERRLAGGNLTAAGGWCAPSENIYTLCDPAATDGLVDIPQIVANRGGIKFAQGVDFAALYAGGFHQTEAEAIAGTEKPCIDIACPSFTDLRLDVDGICLSAPILTNRAFPELIESFVANALAAHVHRINAAKIADMVAASTAVTATIDPRFGAATDVLERVEMHAEYERYRNRLSVNATIEVVAPLFLRGAMRADLAKKNGVSNHEVTDEDLRRYFAARKTRIQWVYDWQDALATGVAGDFGGTTPPANWPANVTILIYPAGTFFAAVADVITLDGIYDSTGLSTNVFTRLFTEEGVAVGKQCYTSIALTLPLCASGGSGTQQEAACANPA